VQQPPPANWAPPIQTGPAPGVSYAGAGQRLIAYIVDGFIMGLIVWFFIIIGTIIAAVSASGNTVNGGGVAVGGIFLLVGIAVDILWKPYWWSHGGQTPAYKMLHLRVVREQDGGPLGFGQAFLRLIGYIINDLIFGIPLGFIWVLFDARRQGWHDKIANTVVITV
jgi:uncharacterized RDD family membrane protein YckC